VRIDPGVERFTDLQLGPIEQSPADQCGDLPIKDRDGHWTYQFAVSVDDMEQGVTLVIRGEDLLSSTGRQIALSRMLGRAAPRTSCTIHSCLRDRVRS
jgi:glutamyl-tRNA synthetase/glutamyl-Q tRNA(Asp) synthetase